MTKFFCTYCGQKLSAKPSMVGTFLACPVCKNRIEVPDFLKPQVNRFATIPLAAPAPPARPGEASAAPATPQAIIPPPAAPAAIIAPPETPAAILPPEPIEEEPLPPAPAATLPPAAPIPTPATPATPAAALPPAVFTEPAVVPSPQDIISAETYSPDPAPAAILAPPATALPPLAPMAVTPGSPPSLPGHFPHHAQTAAPHSPIPRHSQRKNPTLAAVLSIIPGLGQMYNGQFFMGIILLIITSILYLAIPFGLALHIYLIIDARNCAHKINACPPDEHLFLAIEKGSLSNPRHIAVACTAILVILASASFLTWKVNEKEPEAITEVSAANPTASSPSQTTAPAKASEPAAPVRFSEPDGDGWVSAGFHRLQLNLPSKPQQLHELPAKEVAKTLVDGTWDRRQTIVGECYIDIGHGTFKEPANLQGAANETIMGLAKHPYVSRMKTTSGETTISGRQAAALGISFHLEDELQNVNSLTIVEGHEIWYVHVMGPPQEAATYWKRIRDSMEFK